MVADVVLPLPLTGCFTYAVPAAMQGKIGPGFRVVVPFGKRKFYTAVVLRLHHNAPKGVEVKEIHSLTDSHPVVNEHQLRLWEWISFYYLSPPGEVYKAAMPSMMKPRDLEEKYKSKTETFIRLNTDVHDIHRLVGRAKKQAGLYGALRRLLEEEGTAGIPQREITAKTGYSHTVLKGLTEKNLVIQYREAVSRIDTHTPSSRQAFELTPHQQKARDEINRCFEEKNVCLLHGVTSSGKTEIYIHLIREQLKNGKQTLYLLPEIALTTQLTSRLRAVFGDKLGIYHSRINDSERAEIWQKMVSDSPYEIVIGVRSALFLPFRQLGLVIVDEEHETGYKQQEPAPRYNARDTAIVLAQTFGAKTLLGSATPAIETFHNAKTGKYGLVTLEKRFEEIELPRITLENTRELRRTKKMKTLLAPELIDKIKAALEAGQQVILFRNRRGFAPMLECRLCGWTPKCGRCDVSLAYHKNRGELKCHYCNRTYKPVSECPVCHEKSVEAVGTGTEKLEEEVAQLFPGAVVARMDTDTTRGKNAYAKIISDFRDKKVHILVGTQMLSKGLDFDNVGIVGIISADGLLNRPDFRSHERGFQLMLQAAGRAGRKNRRGEVVIQTADPGQPVYRYLAANDYEGFYHAQLSERKLFNYPPYSRLITVVFRHKDECKAEAGAAFFARLLKQSLGERVLGPNKPLIGRVQQYHIRHLLLKLDSRLSPVKTRQCIQSVAARFRENPGFRSVLLHFDADPMS